MLWFYILIFIGSCALLYWASNFLVGAILGITRFLGWKEFVVAFLIVAFATSLPNFFVGMVSVINKVPELSFGDVVGANVVDLSLVMALAGLLSKAGLTASSRAVQSGSLLTVAVAILPLILIQDGILSRADGILLWLIFLIYIFWLFNKKERFTKVYDEISPPSLGLFFKNLILFFTSIFFVLIAAQGIVKSGIFFAEELNLPIGLIGILIVGLGTSLPETSIILQAAKKNQDWLILGNLMGSVVITTTFVLGTVSLISPIKIPDFSPFAIARVFVVISALFFFFFVRSHHKISKKESLFLLGVYISFLLIEILIK